MLAPCLLTLASFLLEAEGQMSSSFSRSLRRDGRCIYSFSVAGPAEDACSEPGEALAAVRELRSEREGQQRELAELADRLRLLESWVVRSQGQLSGQQGESLNILQRLQELERENRQLRAGHCPRIGRESRQGAQSLTGSSSRQRTQPDGRASSWSFENRGFQELKSEITEIPASSLIQRSDPGGQDTAPDSSVGCGMLEWVGDPVTFQKADSILGKYGVWMKDPEPVPHHTRDTIWRINTVGTDVRLLYEYNDMDQFVKGHPSKVYVLPEPVESTGSVIYRGSLYYQKRKSRTLLRYEMKTETILVQKDLTNAGYQGVYPYSWGGYTDIDFAVDEMGLWVIYSTHQAQGAIVISKLDPKTLQKEQTWTTTIRRRSVANSFMICGILYTLNSYSNRHAIINFAYNTNTNTSKVMNIPFENRYRYNCMTDYNPAEKKILAWDNFNMVMYDIRLSKL
ncbi:myocilin isoform X1 [Stegostoma tigrinum]|uniref:myocilin isoform X1 n=1 Tax=Stegostoma tigrinum TaxID=3053191 RepID=UPI00202B7155|nr:myocilin isoform X1 [Stegostoma tigrinum]